MRVGSVNEVVVDTRVIAASHVDLDEAVAAGRFRADLYFRLNVLQLRVPPLRERREDIPRLARHVYEQTAAGRRLVARGFHSDAITAMVAYGWPGTVRSRSAGTSWSVMRCWVNAGPSRSSRRRRTGWTGSCAPGCTRRSRQ